MPFKSVKQRKYLFAKHPDIAMRWVKDYGFKIVASKSKTKKRKK